MRPIPTILAALLLVAGLAPRGAVPVAAADLRGPKLAVASSFGQSVPSGLMETALSLGVDDFRDELFWYRVDDGRGRFTFDEPLTTWPDALPPAGATASLLVNNGHQAHDGGNTPRSAAAVAGFGRHAAEVLRRFPAITSVEVGNEFNSDNFVSGPLRDEDLDARARAYTALLISVRDAVRAVRPEARIIGGGVHSIPVDYLSRLADLGAAEAMDSLALHPYDTPIELIPRQIAVMRREIPALADMPVEITEFGSESPETVAEELVRGYCSMALAGVTRLAWYALNERGDDYVPLIDADLATTRAWTAFAFLRDRLEGVPVEDAAPDPFTHGCLFDRRVLILWGMPRALTVTGAGVEVLDATGRPLPGRDHRLSETRPLILSADHPLEAGRDYRLAPQRVLADSFHQFSYPAPGEAWSGTDGFRRFARDPDGTHPLVTMPGQSRSGVPWTPWLGLPQNGDVRVLSGTIQPAGASAWPVEIVHEFTAAEPLTARIDATFTASGDSVDGIDLVLRRNGQELTARRGARDVRIEGLGVDLARGDRLEFAIGPGAGTQGDLTAYRITLRRAE